MSIKHPLIFDKCHLISDVPQGERLVTAAPAFTAAAFLQETGCEIIPSAVR